jgi:hypothetical protein
MKKEEKETIIRWDSAEKLVWIDSAHLPVWRRVERAGFTPVRVRTQHGREVGRQYRVPLANFRFRLRRPDQPRREASPGAFRRKIDAKRRENDVNPDGQGNPRAPPRRMKNPCGSGGFGEGMNED